VSITEETDLHPRVLKRHYVEVNDVKWEVSTVLLVEEPESLGEAVRVLVDIVDGVTEKYETMIFKVVDGVRAGPIAGGATSFGHYRSNDSQDIVKAHGQIVSLIANGRLVPVECKAYRTSISPHILKAMREKEIANEQA